MTFYLDQQWMEVEFFQTLKGGRITFHASLANIYDKCYKKAVFMKNN